jgi:hypothetical protein
MGRQCNGSREEKLIWGMVIVSALRAFTTEVPADRGSGSHGSHCVGPPGLSSQWASAPLEMLDKCPRPDNCPRLVTYLAPSEATLDLWMHEFRGAAGEL